MWKLRIAEIGGILGMMEIVGIWGAMARRVD